MTTSDAAVDKTAEKTRPEKVSEKLTEKRRALGRGLESLLPGPRVVPASSHLPQSTRKDGAPAVASSQFPVPSSQEPDSALASSSSGADGGRAGTPVAPLEGSAGRWTSCRRWLRGGRRMGRRFFFWLWIRSIPILTRRGESLIGSYSPNWQIRSGCRECCSRWWCVRGRKGGSP